MFGKDMCRPFFARAPKAPRQSPGEKKGYVEQADVATKPDAVRTR
jgi:hypothetical protein